MPKENRVIVEGINIKLNIRNRLELLLAEIKHQEGPIHVSNVMLYDEKAKAGTKSWIQTRR